MSSFGEISNTNQCQSLFSNLGNILNTTIPSRVLNESAYWTARPSSLLPTSFTGGNTGANAFLYRYMTGTELGSYHIHISGTTSTVLLIPPAPADIVPILQNKLGRSLTVGDTFGFNIANASTASAFLLTTNNSTFSDLNASNNGWMHRFIFPGQASAFWIRITDITPGAEKYEFIRLSGVYGKFADIPPATVATIFPDNAIVTNIIAYAVGNVPAPTGSGGYDTGVTDPSTGIPP